MKFQDMILANEFLNKRFNETNNSSQSSGATTPLYLEGGVGLTISLSLLFICCVSACLAIFVHDWRQNRNSQATLYTAPDIGDDVGLVRIHSQVHDAGESEEDPELGLNQQKNSKASHTFTS